MALSFTNTGVVTGQPVETFQVSQSFDAFTGAEAYDIVISGSLDVDGSVSLTSVTGSSYSGSFTGSFEGTSSFTISSSTAISSSYALSSSQAITASFVVSASRAVSSSFATSASQAITASFASAHTARATRVLQLVDRFGGLEGRWHHQNTQATPQFAAVRLQSTRRWALGVHGVLVLVQ